jgi:hypothetical protein
MVSRRHTDVSVSEISDLASSLAAEAQAAFGPPDAWPDGLRATLEATCIKVRAVVARNEALVLRTENLERALDSNRQIGVAIGILVAQRKITQDAAFELMRAASQQQHRKLASVADDVIRVGTVLDTALDG